MLRSGSSRQFAEWLAFWELEPFGEEWKQTAYLCTMVGNGSGGKDESNTPYQFEEFMPVTAPEEEPEPQSPEEQLAIFLAYKALWSGR